MTTFLIVCGSILILFVWASVDHYRMNKLAEERGNPNICEYARSFDYRNVDTRIMREVWNELQLNLGYYNGKPFPVKAGDRFQETYNMHADDLDDIYWSVADSLGIDTENPEGNPFYGKVTSVKNLVLFIHNQPRIGRNAE